MSCAEAAELIDLPFGLWTQVGRRKRTFNRIRQVSSMCPHGREHWRHLANTTEPSVCGSNAVIRLRQCSHETPLPPSNYFDHLLLLLWNLVLFAV